MRLRVRSGKEPQKNLENMASIELMWNADRGITYMTLDT